MVMHTCSTTGGGDACTARVARIAGGGGPGPPRRTRAEVEGVRAPEVTGRRLGGGAGVEAEGEPTRNGPPGGTTWTETPGRRPRLSVPGLTSIVSL